jgi:hypothetical protein
MVWVDETRKAGWIKSLPPPTQRRLGGFGCISLSMFRGSEDPAEFGNSAKRRFQVSLEIPETNLTNKFCRFSFLDHPVSKSEKRPMTEIPQKSRPALFRGARLSSHIFRYGGIAPERLGVGKIAQPVASQPEPLRLNNRYI